MADNDVRIVVTGDNNAGPAVNSAQRDILGLELASSRASRALRGASDAYDNLGDQAQQSGVQMSESSRHLGSEVDRVRVEVMRLRGEYERTGDAAHLTALQTQTRRLAEIQRELTERYRDTRDAAAAAATAQAAAARSGQRDTAGLVNANHQVVQSLREADVAYRALADHGRDTGTALSHETLRLGHEINGARTEIARLNDEYTRTGDPAHLRALDEQHRRLQSIGTALHNIGSGQGIDWSRIVGDAGQAGEQAGSAFGNGISGVFQAMPAEMKAALVVGAVAAAIPIASAVGGALAAAALLAFGGGGIAAGVAGAFQDPRVQGAVTSLGAQAQSVLGKAGESFIGPVEHGLSKLGSGLASLGLDKAIRPMADTIGNIVDGLVRASHLAMPGITTALAAAAPLFRQLGEDLPALGLAMGDFGMSIAAVGPQATAFLHDLILLVSGTVMVLGDMIGTLATVYGWCRSIAEFLGLADPMREIPPAADAAAVSMDGLGQSTDDVAAALQKAQEEARSLSDIFDEMTGKAVGSREAYSAYQAAIDEITKSIKENGRTLDLNTEHGRNNNDALMTLIETTKALAGATYDQINATQGHAAASAAAQQVIAQGREQVIAAAMAMGQSRAQAEALATALLGIPDVNRQVTVNVASAMENVQRVRDAVANLQNKSVTVQVGVAMSSAYAEYYYGKNAGKYKRFGGVHMAAGGLLNLGGQAFAAPDGAELYGFAEKGTGGEAFIARNAPDGSSLAYADQAARWHGGRVVRNGTEGGSGSGMVFAPVFHINALDPKAAADAVGQALDNFVRQNGPLPARMVAAA
jgi:hypothetical protein